LLGELVRKEQSPHNPKTPKLAPTSIFKVNAAALQ
jgi:hypothetical protein